MLRRHLGVGAIATVVVLLLALAAREGNASAASSLTLTPVADTYVNQSTPSTAYGSATQLVVDGSPTNRSFLRFDLTGVTGVISSATLRLHVADTASAASASGGSVSTVSAAWSEAGTTWNSRPATGSTLGTFGRVSRNTWVQLNVTSAVAAGTTASFGLTSTNSDGAIYDSRERGAVAPQLVLTMAPLPTATPTATPTTTPTATPTPTPGGTVTLVTVADTFVDADTPSTPYGTGTQLIADGSPVRELLLRFDLTSLSGPVQSARLRLHVANSSSAGSPAGGSVARVADNTWSESAVTYATRPTTWDGAVSSFGSVSANTWVETDVTTAVTSGGLLTLGVRSTNSDGAYYDSREVTGNAPRLLVTLGTPPPPVTGAVVMAVGDTVCAPGSAITSTTCRQQAISNLMVNEPGLQFALLLGDLQYETGTLSAFQSAYEPSYGRVKAKTKPVPGNHEYETPGASGYYTYFGAAAGDPAKGYYSFDVGSTWHVVALNSNCSDVPCAAGSVQEQWLRADLAASGRPCTLAFWHHPRFSSGASHGDNTNVAPFWDALQQYGAELALAGHEHNYERFDPQLPSGAASASGIAEFIVGGGGRSLHGFATPKPNSVVRISAFGVLRLTLGDNAYAWQLIGESGAIMDSGTANCH